MKPKIKGIRTKGMEIKMTGETKKIDVQKTKGDRKERRGEKTKVRKKGKKKIKMEC